MKLNWEQYLDKTINITMNENYGMRSDPNTNSPIYEIVFKSGKLIGTYDEGLLLETEREKEIIKIFIPYQSIKCVEIFNF